MYRDGAIQYSGVERSPEGFILRLSAIEQYQGLLGLAFGLVWTLGTGAILYGVVQDGIDFVTIFPIVFIGVFVMIGLLIVAGSVAQMLKDSRVHPPELILPTYPLSLGETIPIHYRRRLRRDSFRSSARVTAELICDEWVQYSQGTDTITKTHTIWKQVLSEQTIAAGESQADYMSDIHIRPQGPPSFSARHNKLRYRLIIKLQAPNTRSSYDSEFSLQVMPAQIA